MEKDNKQATLSGALKIIITITLFSTVTNFIPLSAALIFLAPLIVVAKAGAPKFMRFFWLFTIASILSTAFYAPSSFLEIEFLRRDGNYFVSFAPLFVLPYFLVQINVRSLLKNWLLFSLIVYTAAFSFWFVTDRETTFGGLYVARNAVGSFLSQACCAAYVFSRIESKKNLLFLLFFIMMMVATYSRGSILGFIAGVIIFELVNRYKNTKTTHFLAFSFFAFLFVLTFSIGFINLDLYKETFAQGFEYLGDASTGKEANIFIRAFFVWPKAVDLFFESPLFGLGFGSFDDVFSIDRSIPFFATAVPVEIIHSDAHAHNTYLHVLAEQGIFGLSLLLLFIFGLFRHLVRSYSENLDVVSAYLIVSLSCIVFASFTEHRLFTPSMALPLTIPLAAYLASARRRKKQDFLTKVSNDNC